MAELVDAPDLGSGVFGREGSSPFIRINSKKRSLLSLQNLLGNVNSTRTKVQTWAIFASGIGSNAK